MLLINTLKKTLMAWRINKISIENFKFFLEPFVLEPKGKNVLMYGENGSGKSSIYWAAYTHFQSSLKDAISASKYFEKKHQDSLCNLYDFDDRRSGIEIEFVDPNNVKKTYTDGSWAINTSSDEFMKHSTFASDFMNYKFLSAIFDFKNSLKSATKPFNVLLACTRPLITELSYKLRKKCQLLPTTPPYPIMRLETIRSIIPISCRRHPKSVWNTSA